MLSHHIQDPDVILNNIQVLHNMYVYYPCQNIAAAKSKRWMNGQCLQMSLSLSTVCFSINKF